MPKLAQLTDANGTSVESYATTLVEKCDDLNVSAIVLVMVPPNHLEMVTNVDPANLPEILNQLASLTKKKSPEAVKAYARNPANTN